ncbi:hypothetical protein Bbelb_011880 [Branchiostoma belcheri]|nr:hypothetical protein Bbelb_011880 [Branchiostoma belcheri]
MATDGGDTKTDSNIPTCGVCLEELRRPRLLPCGHECCMKCLEYWEQDGRSPLLCPTCRQVVYLPPEGIAGLMKPLWVGNCHRLSSRTTDDKNASGPGKGTTCRQHEKCGLTWYCSACERTVCRECVTTEHAKHPVSHIAKLVERKKQEALGLVERGSEKAAALQARLRYLAACRYELERQQAEAERAIEEAAQTLREEIERQKHSSLHWLNSLCGEEFEKLAGAQTRTEQDFAQLASALNLVISFGKTANSSNQNPMSLLSAVKALSQAVQGVDVRLSHTIIKVKFVPSKTGANIGNVAFTTGERFRLKQHHNNLLPGSHDNNNAILPVESSTGSEPMLMDQYDHDYDTPATPNTPLVPPTPPAHRKVQVGDGYGSETGQFKNPFALAVSSHYLYVADRANGGRVQIFDFCGNLVRSFLLMLGKGLEALTGGIVLMPNGTIKYLGGGHETMICDRAGRAVGRACYPVMTAYNPNGKCISRTKLQIRQGHLVDAVALPNGNIAVVAITGLWERADCILLSERGQKLCEVHSSQTSVGNCVSLSVNPNSGDILVCEPRQGERDRVTLFNSQGRPKSTTLQQLGHTGTTTNGISVDTYGYIISSTKNARLQLYDPNGAYIKDVASGKDGLKRPSKVAATRDRRVAVIDEGAVCVFMFSYY